MSKPFSDLDKTNNARRVLADCGIDYAIDREFFVLRPSQVQALLDHPATRAYRKPKNANGSRGRYLFAYLSRRANGVTVADARAV